MYRKQILCLLLVCLCAMGSVRAAAAAEVDCDATYCFTQEDFSEDESLYGICVTALPDPQTGTVMLGSRVICVGDILTAGQVEQMTFVPLQSETDQQALVTYLPIYENRVDNAATMTISIRGKKDQAPVAEDQTLETYKNLSNSAALKATDPEGLALTYTVTRQPRRGTVEISQDGSFTYTPKKNKVGTDSFTYTATDPAGNVSREATVTVTILKPGDNAQYSDTMGSACRFAAEWLKNTGLFVGQQVDGKLIFDENAPVSQGQFLAMAVKVLGIPVDEGLSAGSYGENVPSWLQPYLAAALRSGLTSGLSSFNASEAVTGAQAAVMLQNGLDLDLSVAATGDGKDDTVPHWASAAVTAMAENGIDIHADATMTRGEMAIVLYKISKLAATAPGLQMYQ